MTRALRIKRTTIYLAVLASALMLVVSSTQRVNADGTPPYPPIQVYPDTTKVTNLGDSSAYSSGSSLLDLILASLITLAAM